MLQVEKKIYNILDDENSRKWKDREDILMAAVFGTAMYFSFEQLLGPILAVAKPLRNGNSFPSKKIKGQYYGELWPSFRDIYEYDPNLIYVNNDQRKEPDAFCEFEEDILIIEAKRPKAIFIEDQLITYLEALQKNKRKNLWLLAVGKGGAAAKSIMKFANSCEYDVLYVDWTTIQTVTIGLSKKAQGNVTALYKDINRILEKHKLKPFEGFEWPIEFDYLKSMDQKIQNEWFPHHSIEWPHSIYPSIVFSKFKQLPWGKNIVS